MSDMLPALPASAALAPHERRQTVRFLCNRVCYARPNGTAAGITWGLTLWDISRTGLRVFLPCDLQRGTVLAIQPFRDSDNRVLLARIVWASHQPHGWSYGCEWLQPLGEPELAEMVNGQ
jgi:hypothetical protein